MSNGNHECNFPQDEQVQEESLRYKIFKAIQIYKRKHNGEDPTWLIIDPKTRQEILGGEDFKSDIQAGGHISNTEETIRSLFGLKMATADQYRGFTLEVA